MTRPFLVEPPVAGILRVDAKNYPNHPAAWKRPAGNREPAMVHDFGPSSVPEEPNVLWPGGEGIPAKYYTNFHKGIDISTASCGAAVLAPMNGIVRSSYVTGSGEHVIVLNHGGGWCTSYGHMASRAVAKGARVVAGQKIGTIGNTGNSRGCHLHFGVKSDVPAGANYYSVTVGKMRDPWPRLTQNVTAWIPGTDTVNIRETAGEGTTPGAKWAQAKADGSIVKPDGTTVGGGRLGHRKFGGWATGAAWTLGGVAGNTYVMLEIDGAMRYVAEPLVELSVK